MADELESGGQTAVADAGAGDSGAALQSEMTGDFFYDDGSDSVVDANGNAQRDSEGNVIRRMEDFTKVNGGQKSQPTQPQSGLKPGLAAPVQPQQALGFDSVFQKDGKFDYDSVAKYATRISGAGYQMQAVARAQAPQVSPPPVPVDPKEQIKTEIATHKQTLDAAKLEPIRKLYQGIQAAYQRQGQQIPAEVYDSVNSIYLQKEQELNDELDKKRDEIFLDRISNGTSESSIKDAEKTSTANFKQCANEFLAQVPEAQREAKLTELVFGHKDPTAPQGFRRGHGADVIEHAFDVAMQGKQFNTDAEWKQAYNNWWLKYSSNSNNLSYVVKQAYKNYLAAPETWTQARNEHRRAWDAEQESKNRTRNQTSHASGNLGMSGGQTDLLAEYHKAPPARNFGR